MRSHFGGGKFGCGIFGGGPWILCGKFEDLWRSSRRSLRQKKKVFQNIVFPKKPTGTTCVQPLVPSLHPLPMGYQVFFHWPNHKVFPATPASLAGIDATHNSQMHSLFVLLPVM